MYIPSALQEILIIFADDLSAFLAQTQDFHVSLGQILTSLTFRNLRYVSTGRFFVDEALNFNFLQSQISMFLFELG